MNHWMLSFITMMPYFGNTKDPDPSLGGIKIQGA